MKIYCPKCKAPFEAAPPPEGEQSHCPKCGDGVDYPASPIAPGAVIGDFLIEREISKGGMGEVYLARQLSLDRPVALKVLQDKLLASNPEYVDSLFHEARAAARINHPNIVQAYAVGEENGIFYFAMEYIKGETFKQILKQEKVLAFNKAAKVIREIASALDVAWREQKLVHQDIKPDNIMLDANGFSKLADLGLARVATNEHEEDVGDEVMGTPQYISPEQLTGVPTDVRSDLYSLGATFYQFVTGRFPYVADTTDQIARMHVEGNLTPPKEVNKELPDELNTIIMKMMARDPADRYQTPVPLIKALDLFLDSYRGPQVPALNLGSFNRKSTIAPGSFRTPTRSTSGPIPTMTPPPTPSAPTPVPTTTPTPSAPMPVPTTTPAPAKPAVTMATPQRPPPSFGRPAPTFAAKKAEPETAKEPEEEEKEAPPAKEKFRLRFSMPPVLKKIFLLLLVLILLAVLAAAALGILAHYEKLPEALKPYGQKVLALIGKAPGETTQPSEGENPSEKTPDKPPIPVKPAETEPPKPPAIVTRPAYLAGVTSLLNHVRSNPDDQAWLLREGDAFFSRYPQPVTDEERNAVQLLLEVYARADETNRAQPARSRARERHLQEIAERKAAIEKAAREKAEAEEEAKRQREAAAEAARKAAEEQRAQAEIDRNRAVERQAKLKADTEILYPAIVEGFYKALQSGKNDEFDEAIRNAVNYLLPAGADTDSEKKMIAQFNAMRNDLPGELKKVRAFIEALSKVTPRNSFSVELDNRELVQVVAIRPNGVVRYQTVSGRENDLPLTSEKLRSQFFSRLESRLKLQNPEFFYRLITRDFDQNTAKLAPAGFWRNNWQLFKP